MNVSRSRLLACAAALSAALAGAVTLPACGGGSASSSSVTGPTSPLPALDEMLADKVIGSASAPVTIIEYSSLSCSHCGTFHDTTLPQVKAAYLDTGQVRFVYRDFPLDGASLSAAMIARCSGDRYFTVLGLIFRSQGTWTRANDIVAALKQAVAPSGMTAGDVDACIASVALRDGIIAAMDTARSQYAVNATPTFIIGDQKVQGALSFAEFDAILGLLIH